MEICAPLATRLSGEVSNSKVGTPGLQVAAQNMSMVFSRVEAGSQCRLFKFFLLNFEKPRPCTG